MLLVPLLLCRFLRTLQLFLPLTRKNGAREARKEGRGVAAVEAVAVVEAALGAAVAAVAVVPQAEGALEEVLTRLLEEVRPAMVRGPSSSSHTKDNSSSRDSSSGRHHNSFNCGDPHCSGVLSSTGALHHSGDLEDPGALATTAALPARPLAPCGATPAPATTGASPARAVPVSAAATTTLRHGASAASTTSTVRTGVLRRPLVRHRPGQSLSVMCNSTTLLCPVVPFDVLCGLHIPSFTRNLVGVGYLQNKGITVTFVGGGRTAVCTDAATGAVLATFTRESRSGLYVLHTECSPIASSAQVAASPQVPVSSPVAVSSQVVVSGQVAASCSCWSLAHPTILWHHRLGHLTLPRLRSMASHSLVSGLPLLFPSLPPLLAPPRAPCVAGCLRATPHSSSLRPATGPFQNLHLDVWGPAPTLGPEREHYFLVVVDDYSRYTTVFPLAKKSEVTSTLIRWLLATEGTHGCRVRCLHSDRGGEFLSDVLAGFCGEHGIRQSWTLPESPQQNGVAERRIGLVMDIARTSMIHARTPHFLWPYTLRYAAHQLNLQPLVSRPEVSPTSLWTGSPGAGSAFRVVGYLALVRNTSVDKLSARTIPCVFLGFLVTVDSRGVGAGGARTGGARSGGARSRGAGVGGTGTGGASSGGAGARGAGTGGASSGGAGAGGWHWRC
ncbi:unnamed protein product [Closterium sp. NIES-54]